MAADALSRVFSALADPLRRDMVARLAVADATVNELAEPYSVTVQAVSKHLKVLADAGLVSRSRQAQRRPVHLEAEVFDLMTHWIERYRRQAEERYRRLDDLLRELPDESGPTSTPSPHHSPRSEHEHDHHQHLTDPDRRRPRRPPRPDHPGVRRPS
jgi:DNA-binding transcriptional ArsR family regulator